jgi:hypothetical protein
MIFWRVLNSTLFAIGVAVLFANEPGPLHQLHPGRFRSLIRHYHRLHRSPPSVEFLPVRWPLHPLSLDGLSDRNGTITILATRLDAKCGMAVLCLFRRTCLLGNVLLY